MTSKRTKAERRKYQRALAKNLLNPTPPYPPSPGDPPPHIMSSARRDSSPRRGFSRPFSPPRGPRAEYQDQDGNFHFNSDRVRPPRDRYRERSRSRSPESGRKRPSERHEPYKYRGENDRRPPENNYRPIYNDTPTRTPPLADARRASGMNTSGHSSPLSKAASFSKASLPPKAPEERESIEEAQATSSANQFPTWHDRAMNAPASLPTSAARMPPPVSEESHARVDKALGEVFKKVIDVAVTKSALQSQQFAARRRVERRNAEFEKSKPHHEKFPSIKESQTASKSDADRDYKIITEKVDEKDSLLNSLAMQAAEQLIPTLLARGAGNSAEQKNLQHRYESLEKTCKGFEKLLEEQRTLLEEQRKANEALKEKHLALEKDFRSVQGQFRDTQDVLQQVKISERAIEALRTDLATTKGDAAKILADSTRVSSELKTQARKIEALATGEDVETLRKGLKTLEETTSKATETSEEQFKILSEKLDKVDKLKATSDGLVNRLTNFAADQTKFREAWVQLSDRIDAVANRPDPTTLEDRLQKLEKISTLEVKESATKKELDALRDRVKQIERTPPPTAQNLPAKSNSKALDSRVDALEKRMIPVFASLDKLSTLEKNGIFTLKASEFVARNELKAVAERVKTIESKANVLDADNLSKGIDAKLEQRLKGLETDVSKFADFNKRINEVEDNQRRASSQANSAQTSAPLPNSRANPNSSSSAQPQFDELTSRISNLEKQVDDAKELQKVFEETWAGVVHDSITEESQKLQTRIASVEGKSFELNNNLEKLRESGLRETGFEESKKSILSEVVEIFKNRPNLLPFPTIDQVNTALVPFSGLAQMGSQIQRLHESTEATNLALGNLQSRVDNINTLDLANHIMGQLYALHPEATMNELKSDLKGLNARLSELVSTVDNLKGSTQNLEARVQDQETAEAMRQQYQDLRKEVDSLTEDGDSIRRRVKDAEKNFKDLSAIVNTTSKELGNLQTENEENKQTIAEEFARFQGGVEEQLEKIKEAASRVQVSKATSPAVSHTSNRSNQNGISRGPRPNFSTANRQPSATNDKSNKKRKLDNGTSAKTNGVRPGSSSGSPQSRKRHRRHPGGDDPEDDPDYSEEIPQPGVSSDEDSKPKPLKKSTSAAVIDLSGLDSD